MFTDALNVTAEWLKHHVNFEKTTEPFNDIIARAYMEVFNWDENVTFPEVIILQSSLVLLFIKIVLFILGFVIRQNSIFSYKQNAKYLDTCSISIYCNNIINQ